MCLLLWAIAYYGQGGDIFLNFELIKVLDDEGNKECTYSYKKQTCLMLYALVTSLLFYCLVEF